MSSNVPSVGVVGAGFVGGSIADGLKLYTDVKVYDISPERRTHEYEEVISQDVLFVALPTPMKQDGTVDITIVTEALNKLYSTIGTSRRDIPVIIKSTVPPEALNTWHRDYSDRLFITFSPEFLKERCARLDFQQTNRLIFGSSGGDQPYGSITIKELFAARFPQVPVYWTSFEEASLIKYFTNVFFATKISLMNEFAQIAESYGLRNFDSVMGKVLLDQRIGRSHWQVPGHDGGRGFSGSCFPKDINGYLHIARQQGVDPKMGQAAWDKNLEVRPERDWEQLTGRAVSKEDEN